MHEDGFTGPGGPTASPDSVLAAAHDIERGAAAIRRASPGRSAFAAEFEALLDHAEARGLIRGPEFLPAQPDDHGQEHTVWFHEPSNRVFKATYPNRFGLSFFSGESATPLEYFRRLTLTNDLFGDDIRFEAVVNNGGRLQVVISQPVIKGESPTGGDVCAFLEELGFLAVELNDQTVWFHADRRVLVADAHTRNFVKTPEGVVPIDLNVVAVPADLLATIRAQL